MLIVMNIENVKVKVVASVNPTEDPAKVLRALKNLFPNIEFKLLGEDPFKTYLGEAEGLQSLERLKELWRIERIRAAAREYVRRHRVGKMYRLFFHKQAAYVGRASFAEAEGESPLGPISLEITCDNPDTLLNWITEGV